MIVQSISPLGKGFITDCKDGEQIYTMSEPRWKVGDALNKDNFYIPEGKKAYRVKPKESPQESPATPASATTEPKTDTLYTPKDKSIIVQTSYKIAGHIYAAMISTSEKEKRDMDALVLSSIADLVRERIVDSTDKWIHEH